LKTDVIIIGSGIGGMTAASALAQIGKKVVVLEKARDFGGLTTSFRRHRWRFNTGLHMHAFPSGKGQARHIALWEALGGGRMTWKASNFRYMTPGRTWEMPSERKEIESSLKAMFPGEARLVKLYLDEIASIAHDFDSYCLTACMAEHRVGAFAHRLAGSGIRKRDGKTMAEFFDAHGFSRELRDHLSFFWDNHGAPPKHSGLVPHGLIADTFVNGCYLPGETSSAIAEGFRDRIEGSGGTICTDEGVEDVLVEGGRVRGVSTSRGRLLHADSVISCAGAVESYALLPAAHRPEPGAIQCGDTSFLQVYAGLEPDVRGEYPIRQGCYWYYPSSGTDVEPWNPDVDGFRPPYLGLQFLEDGTLAIMVAASWKPFDRWSGTSLRRRGEEYEEYMRKCGEGMLALAEEAFPGLRSAIKYFETASPLTVRDYTHHPGGRCYGVGGLPGRYTTEQLRPATPVKGFFLGGQDVCNPGVFGGFLGGLMAVVSLTRRDVGSEILKINGISV